MANNDEVTDFDFEKFDNSLDDFFAEDDDFSEDIDFSEDVDFSETVDFSEDIDFSEEENFVAEDQNSIATEVVDNKMNTNESKMSDSKDPLLKLNVIVLELDWEISDKNVGEYISEINNLMAQYQKDRPIYLFFKLHAAIGEYILKKKARSHPDALKFMYGVYNSLKKALSEGVPLVEKNRMILDEVNNFKTLKQKMFPGFYPEVK